MASRNLGTLTLDLVAKIGGFEKGMDQAARIADKRMREIQRNAKLVGAAIGAALVAGAGIVAKGVRDIIDEADKLNDLNQRLGLSAEALSGYAYAAKQSGTDIESLARGMKLLAKNTAEAVDAGSEQGKLFSALGIDVIDQATGKLRALEDLLPEIAEKFRQLDDATLESAIAQKLFGKSGDELIEFLNLGRQGIADYRDELRAMGGEMNGETLRAADELKDTIAKIQTQFDAIYLQLAMQLLPTLQDFADYLSESAKKGEGVIDIFRGLGTIASWLGGLIEDITGTVRGLTSAFLALGSMAKGVLQGMTGSFQEAKVSINTAVTEMQEAWSRFTTFAGDKSKAKGKSPALVEWIDPPAAGWRADTGLQSRLMGVLGGDGDKKDKKTGKSDAEKEFERLQDLFKRLKEQQAESIALYNQTTEVAKLRYQLENGDLAKLTEEQKALLLGQAEMLDNLDALAKRREEQIKLEEQEIEAMKEHKELVSEMLDDIAFETELLSKNNKEKEIAVELRRLGAMATQEEKDAVRSSLENLQGLREQVDLMDEFRDNFRDNVADVLTGAKSISEAFKSMGDMITQQIARIMAQRFTDWLFGGSGSSGGGGLGGLIGMFFGGSSSSSGFGITSSGAGGITGTVPGFAGGTSFAPGGLSLVGEEGPELVNLPRGAQVMPADRTARMFGGPQIVQHITVEKGASRETAEQAARRAGQEARKGLARTG